MTHETVSRPVPRPGTYVDTRPFWEAAKNKELVLQYCLDTGRFQHYPRPVSIFTGSRNLEWRKVSGNGTIYARTVVRMPGPGLEGRLPLIAVTVDLDEGARMLGNILGEAPDAVRIGQRVAIAWDQLSDDTFYPAFRLA